MVLLSFYVKKGNNKLALKRNKIKFKFAEKKECFNNIPGKRKDFFVDFNCKTQN